MKLLRRWFTWPRAVAACVVMPAILLGAWGFYIDLTSSGRTDTDSVWFWLSILYSTLQLFVMEFNVVNQNVPLPWQLHLARLLAALFLGLAIWETLSRLFHDQWQEWRLSRLKGHAIVCGLGRRGAQLVQGLLAHKFSVVAVELNDTNEHLASCAAQGAIVLIGDAADPALIARAGIGRADFLLIASESDRVNLEIALRAKESVGANSRRRERALKCLVHVSEWEVAEVFRQHRILTSPDQNFDAQLLSYFEESARLALAVAPLDVAPARNVRLVIADFSPMGEAVALQALRIGHFAGGRSVEIVVLDPEAKKRERDFLIRYPQAASAGQIQFLPQSLEDAETRRQLNVWSSDPESHLAIAVCRDDEVLEQPTTVYIWQNQPQDLGQVLSGGRSGAARFVPLGAEEPMASAATILEDRLDRLAKAIHNDYVQARIADGSHNPNDPSHQEWAYLGQGFRSSNRAQADHMDVKLRAVHCRRVPHAQPEKKVTVFTPEEVEMLAEMEHARWCAERFLASWTYGAPKDKGRKISPDLVPWSDLPEPIREYDRQAVRRLPEHLGLLGEEIERL
ncbi:MAG: NAD-binding protein [Planctomycetales bacterium]|nr:NAD-binding protein [Planctomycetales bacterium]